MDLNKIGANAKAAQVEISKLGSERKNEILLKCAAALEDHADVLVSANEIDMQYGRANKMSKGLLDRLCLTKERISGMAEGLRQIASLPDPIGEIIGMSQRPNGLLIGKKRVPIGVIGIIYEARPNVTADAFGLCFKTGNAVILKGGSDAINSIKAIVECLRDTLAKNGVSPNAVQLITDTSREKTREFMRLNEYLDLLIPRGGAGLIRSVVENSTVPVIETGTGNCHIYVDESADFDMASDIIINAKTQRVGVCNACESLLVHEKIVPSFMPALSNRLRQADVELRADEAAFQYTQDALPATEEDWGTEYLDYILSVKTVSNLDEAIAHINKYSTHHSEAIITSSYDSAQRFLDEIDSAAVYVNASTRFTDGFEFGFGAEIGISTQKLHARGPMGLEVLTSIKYIIYGNGQIRK